MANIYYTGISNDSVEIGLTFSDYSYTADSSNFYNNIKEKFEGMENDKLKELTNYAYYNSNSTPENTEKPDNLKVYESVNIENLKLNQLVNQLFHWKGRFDYADQMTYYLTNSSSGSLFHLTLDANQDIHVIKNQETTYMPIFLVRTDVQPENMEDGIYLVLPDNTNETIARCYNTVKITPYYEYIESEQISFDTSVTEYTDKKYIQLISSDNYYDEDDYLQTIDVSLYQNYLDGEGFPDDHLNNDNYNYIGFCIYKDNNRYDYTIVMDDTKIKKSWSNDVRNIYVSQQGTQVPQRYKLKFYDYKNDLVKSRTAETEHEVAQSDFTIDIDNDISKYNDNYIKIKRGYFYTVIDKLNSEILKSYRSISGSHKFWFNAPNNIQIDNSHNFPNINVQLIKWKEEMFIFNNNFQILFERDITSGYPLDLAGNTIYEIITKSTSATLSNTNGSEVDMLDCNYNNIENSVNTDTIKVKLYDLNTTPILDTFSNYTIKYKLKFIYDNQRIDDNKITISGNDLTWRSKSFTIKDINDQSINIYVEIIFSVGDKCLYISFKSGDRTSIDYPTSTTIYTIQIENSKFTDINGDLTEQFIFHGELID